MAGFSPKRPSRIVPRIFAYRSLIEAKSPQGLSPPDLASEWMAVDAGPSMLFQGRLDPLLSSES